MSHREDPDPPVRPTEVIRWTVFTLGPAAQASDYIRTDRMDSTRSLRMKSATAISVATRALKRLQLDYERDVEAVGADARP